MPEESKLSGLAHIMLTLEMIIIIYYYILNSFTILLLIFNITISKFNT